jgi:hypothetical protein
MTNASLSSVVRTSALRAAYAARNLAVAVPHLVKHSWRHPERWLANRPTLVELCRYWMVVPPRELEQALDAAIDRLVRERGTSDLGDYLEFGVAWGTSMACAHRCLTRRGLGGTRLIGFDSFEGLPQAAATDDGGVYKPGWFRSSLSLTRRLLALQGVDSAVLVQGWYGDTLTAATAARHQITRAGLVMIDCDIYTSTKQALEFCEPLVRDAAVFLFDDWEGFDLAKHDLGEKRAFDELLAAHPDLSAEPLPSYEGAAMFLVRRR